MNHKRGHRSSWFPKEFGIRLLPDLFQKFNPMPYKLATLIEPEYSEWIRSRGFAVWYG